MNKIIKQITSNLDGSGYAWLRNLPRLSFIRQILLNGAKANVFSEAENDPISKKTVNIENVSKLRWLMEKRNVFGLDRDNFTILTRDSFHLVSKCHIQESFIQCYSIGKAAMVELVTKVVELRPRGSIDFLRKQLNIKKLVPISLGKKVKSKGKVELSKQEKLALSANFKEGEIPKFSCMMLSPDDGSTPYLAGNKSASGKFILDHYASELRQENVSYDLIVVDIMALIFTQPPSSVFSAPSPLSAFCSWLVEFHIGPLLTSSRKVVLCIDRKELDANFPLKNEVHKKRNGGDSHDFWKLLSFLLDKPVNIVSKTYIPPFSWYSSNRDVRFELIYRTFEELFNSPDKYPFPEIDFELHVDGVHNNGKDLHSRILHRVSSLYAVSESSFTVTLPEADQTIFYFIKSLQFKSCLIKFRDNDIFLSALMFLCCNIFCWLLYSGGLVGLKEGYQN